MSDAEARAFLSEQEREYGQYVAIQQIRHDGALAYNVGDPVPAGNVKLHGYLEQGLVAKTNIKAAAAATDPAAKG